MHNSAMPLCVGLPDLGQSVRTTALNVWKSWTNGQNPREAQTLEKSARQWGFFETFGLIWKEEVEWCGLRRQEEEASSQEGLWGRAVPVLGTVGGRNRKFLWEDMVRKARQGYCSFSRASERWSKHWVFFPWGWGDTVGWLQTLAELAGTWHSPVNG